MERITEKQLENKRFCKTEDSIIRVFFSVKEVFSVSRFIRLAGISRSTLYRHHRNVYEVVPDYERYIMRRTNLILKRLMKIKRIRLRTLYVRLLIFMSAHHEIITLILRFGHHNFTEKIITLLKPKIIATGKITNEEMFDIYAKEIAGLVEKWQRDGCRKNEIENTADKIMYLTDTAYFRLSPLTAFNRPDQNSKSSNVNHVSQKTQRH